MRILFACHRLPYPPNRGGKIRPFNMIRHLSQNHSVTVASLAHTPEEMEQGNPLREHCAEVIAEVLPSRQRWMQMVAALPSSRASSLAYFYSAKLQKRVVEAAKSRPFDVVMVHCAFAAQYALNIPAGLRIMDYGDLDSGKWFDYSAHRGIPLSLGYGIEARKLRRFEEKVARAFDQITVTTDGEADEFRRFQIPKPCTVIPNGVDSKYFTPLPLRPDSTTLVFLGRMDYFPNIQGVERFAREILPLIRTQIPEAKFKIVGSNPSSRVRALAGIPGVEVTGFVSDVRPHLSDAAVSVAPIYLARGTQNKILEAMSAGLPVVCTPQAAKGIRAEAGRDFLVGSTSEEFAGRTVKLLHNPELRSQIAESARAQVEAAHCWPRSMSILDGILDRHASSNALSSTTAPALS